MHKRVYCGLWPQGRPSKSAFEVCAGDETEWFFPSSEIPTRLASILAFEVAFARFKKRTPEKDVSDISVGIRFYEKVALNETLKKSCSCKVIR